MKSLYLKTSELSMSCSGSRLYSRKNSEMVYTVLENKEQESDDIDKSL